jgi:hypothetical protein
VSQFSKIILGSLVLALAAGAFPLRADNDTSWREEAREEQRREKEANQRERTSRDPLEPLYSPGAIGSSGSSTGSGFSAQNPVSPIPKPTRRPWNVK